MPGWDVSDGDGDARVPQAKAVEHWHGSASASLLATRLLASLGAQAGEKVKFLPIKALSDVATRPDMSQGYEGIRLASHAKADIIVCAWSGGTPTQEQKDIVRAAVAQGALVIASAGNGGFRTAQFPGSLPGVLCVGAVDSSGHKLWTSSQGDWVSMAARGDSISVSVAPLLQQRVFFAKTSRAAVEVAAVAASLKALRPNLTSADIRRLLMASSRPLETTDPSLVGGLGAGELDAEAAMRMVGAKITNHDPRHPAGILRPSKSQETWAIEPLGGYRELRLQALGKLPAKGTLEVLDSGKILWKGPLKGIGDGFRVMASRAVIRWKGPVGDWRLEYRMIGIDSSTLYCQGTQTLNQDSGTIEDGSGNSPYAHDCDCKWQVKTKPGTRVQVDFSQMSTQGNLDQVHLFNGTTTQQMQLLAMFSGQTLPPAIVTPSNELLVWFVTAHTGTGQGWRMHWRAVPESTPMGLVDPPPGQIP
jgi:hypothetical protein